jgi:hypothetical protein
MSRDSVGKSIAASKDNSNPFSRAENTEVPQANEAIETATRESLESKAAALAQIALEAMKREMAAKRFWIAETELGKARAELAIVTDRDLIARVEALMKPTEDELDRLKKDALGKRISALDMAAREPESGRKAYEEFIKGYPDYPGRDQDLIKVGDLRRQIVKSQLEQRFAKIEEAARNKPAEALVMISRLAKSPDLDPDDLSLVISRTSAIQERIIRKELDSVKADYESAMFFLTKVGEEYRRTVESGNTPTMADVQRMTKGTENFAKARGMIAGGIKRLEALQKEDINNILKAKVDGLLETHRASLTVMDKTAKLAEVKGPKRRKQCPRTHHRLGNCRSLLVLVLSCS